jgi:ParB/RepB/Spo0J family partition protein
MDVQLIPVSKIDVPSEYQRDESKVRDDIVRKSIKEAGVQQAVVVVPNGSRYTLVKGSRRIRFAKELGIPKVPAVVDSVPKGEDPERYRDRLRFVLDKCRQDLKPSQKAEVVTTLKTMFGMTHRQIAAYLGIVPDSVRNWLAPTKYIAPIVQAIDAGTLTMQSARVFDGLSPDGQAAVWKDHARELVSTDGKKLHKQLRKQYPPDKFGTYYRDANLTTERLTRKGGTRKAKPRPNISTDEKKKLLRSFELREAELQEFQEELKTLKAEINASIAPISAILRSEKLLAMVPQEMREELQVFAEKYC